jgi:hypothetical protein
MRHVVTSKLARSRAEAESPCLIVLSGLIIRYAMARIAGQSLVREDIANIAVKGVGWAFFVGMLGKDIHARNAIVSIISNAREASASRRCSRNH